MPARMRSSSTSSAKVSETLVDMWAGKSAQEAHDILAQPDVLVTNQSDKERQLPKILKLNETIKQTLEVHAKREAALQQLARAMAAKDARALTAALSVAEKADVAPANLQKGREALAAAQAAHGQRQRTPGGKVLKFLIEIHPEPDRHHHQQRSDQGR